jgi:ribosomal-protein-alanine N-acetyltransferase
MFAAACRHQSNMPTIETPRLMLVPATAEALQAELVNRDALAAVLGVEVPESWPPEHYDADAVRWLLTALAEGRAGNGWGFYYVIERSAPGARPRLCGGGGFVGAPDDTGTVEIGYAIVPERQRRGLARETVAAWIAWAFAHPEVTRVIAHTLPGLRPSIGLLEAAGFSYVGPHAAAGEADAVQYELRRRG